MRLEYVRKADHVDGSAIPLPAGWPAADHVEPDAKRAKEKLDSGRYRKAEPLSKKSGEPDVEQPTIHPHNAVELASPPEPEPVAPAEPVKESANG